MNTIYYVRYKFCQGKCCRQLPNFGSSPKFGGFQKIAEKIAQNFFAIFKIGQKGTKNLPDATKTFKKLQKIARNFYIFVKSTPKKTKNQFFFLNRTELFCFCKKYPKKIQQKAPKFLRDLNLATDLVNE